MRAHHSLLILLSLLSSASAFAEASGWEGCAFGYSQHLSLKSDAGGDIKNDGVACTRTTARSVQTFELGMLADTPPIGARNPVFVDGKPQFVTKHLSNQRDTFAAYAGFGEVFDYGVRSLWGYNIRAGALDGVATAVVRGLIDSEHRLEGKDSSRHSPVSADGRPLLQATVFNDTPLYVARLDGAEAALTALGSVTAGSLTDSATVGLVGSVERSGARFPMPQGLPGMAPRIPGSGGLYAAVLMQATAYDLATEGAGVRPVYVYAKAGGALYLTRSLSVSLEYTHPLTARVDRQAVRAYDYVSATVGYRF